MSNKRTFELELIDLLSDVLGISKNKINSKTLLVEDLGLDSFSATELLVLIEKKYQIKISESDFSNNKTLGDWAHLLTKRCGQIVKTTPPLNHNNMR